MNNDIISQINVEDEMRESYLSYAMSVIASRALPDVRDGLKPVQRRILFAMREMGMEPTKQHRKCAGIIGEVLKSYHPHGDASVYDALVRMAQDFTLRYPLIDGHGNFGSIDPDPPAAYRYTEARLARPSLDVLADIDKETVAFVSNFDNQGIEPTVLPGRLPQLLLNGSSGIAVGMATNIPPHNLSEVINALLALIEKPDLSVEALMTYIPGPDFPTAAIINGNAGIREAYVTGRGKIYVRSRVEIEEERPGHRQALIVTELPYQVNKARLLEKIAELVKEGRLEGIAELRDESDKSGMRMVIELKRGENAEVILNNLYQQTALQTVFGINMVALEDGQPRLLSLPQILKAFLSHRREVVTRRTLYELRKSRERAHILEGLAVALENIDAIIALIKAASDPAAARQALLERPWPARFVADLLRHAGPHSRLEGLPADVGLLEDRYVLTETQAQAILDLRLHRLTGLEQDKIHEEYQEILRRIEGLSEIVRSEVRLMEVIAEELAAIKAQYGDGRRTEILAGRLDLSREDLIAQETVVVTLSHAGYAKCQPLADYRAQRRGGKGRSFGRMREEDFVDRLVVANTHDTVLCFSNRGKAYWLKVYDLPQSGHGAQGRPIVNFLPLAEGEKLTAILPLAAFEEGKSVFMATSDGTVKKTPLADFSRPRTSGIAAIDLVDGNVLVGAGIANGNSDILLFSDAGKAVRFQETDVRSMGRNARGVRGLSLREGQRVVSLMIADPAAGDQVVLVASANGYGKRTLFSEFPRHNRGGQGVISMQVTERNGAIVGAVLAGDEDEVMMITDTGSLIRMCAREISLQSRNTQGVRLMGLDANERLVSVEKIEESAVLANGEVEAETQAMDAGDDDGADL